MNILNKKLLLASSIIISCTLSIHTALIELASKILIHRLNGPIEITPKHECELQRIALKSNNRKDTQLFGFTESLRSGARNPVCIPEIRKNIIDFLGVPLLNYKECTNQDGTLEFYDSSTTWHPLPQNVVLVASKPLYRMIDLPWTNITVYDTSTGKQLLNKTIVATSPDITGESIPRPLNNKQPLYDAIVNFRDDHGITHHNTFHGKKKGTLEPIGYQNNIVLHDPTEREKDLETMTLPQAIALHTIRTIAEDNEALKLRNSKNITKNNRAPMLRKTKPQPEEPKEPMALKPDERVLKILTKKQRDVAIKLPGVVLLTNKQKITPPPFAVKRKRKQIATS
jgi:hypothetical protein